jgi:glycosyltransferase involved in cell wall biosynthesis
VETNPVIALIVRLEDPTIGGGHTFVYEVLSEILNDSMHNKYLILLEKNKNTEKYITKNNKVLHFSRSIVIEKISNSVRSKFPRLSSKIDKLSNLEKLLKQYSVQFSIFLGSTPTVLSVPFALFVWDLQHRTHPWFPEVSADGEWTIRENKFQQVLPKASRVVVGTNVGKEELKHFYGISETNICLIPHPVPNTIYEIDPVMINSQKQLFELIYPAQFWAHKNHKILIEALALLPEDKQAKVLIHLTGSDKGNLEYVNNLINKNNLEKNFIIHGFVSIKELHLLYKRIDALVYPSFSGPENLPPLEALAYNKIIFCSDYPGAREQLEDSAIYFDPLDAKDLSKKLNLYIENEYNTDLLLAASRLIISKKNVSSFVKKLDDMVEEFITYRNSWC